MILAFGLFFNGANGQYNGSGIFDKITEPEQFTTGYYILAGTATSAANRGIMLNTNGSGFINRTSVSTLGATITDAGVQNVFLISIDGNGDFTIYNEASGQYASYSGSGNSALLKDGPVSDSERWNLITTTDGLYRFANKQYSNRFLQYNSGSPRFACYQSASNQQNLTLYKLPAASTIWDGANWSNGAPTATLDATIAGNYNTAVNGAITAKTLTVSSGIFTIESGSSATIQGAVTNNAGAANFIVKSGGHLIQSDAATNVNAITVERNSTPIVRLDHTLWSSPVASQNLFGFSPNTLTNRFYTYDAATNAYVNTGLSSTSTFAVGKGYGVRAPNNHPTTATAWTGTFTGVPNNGTVSSVLSLAGTGFNLVGNPYPSAIDATAFTATSNNSHINGTIYFYAHSLPMNPDGTFPVGTNYSTWNQAGYTLATNNSVIPNGKIQVGQGFIVKATSAGDVTFTNAMRTGGTTQFFRASNAFSSNSELEKHRIWLNLTNNEGSTFNQALIAYVAGATEGYDRNFDGLSFGNFGSSLSTKINGEDYAIQSRSLPFQASDIVPLNLKIVAAGDYTISLANMDGLFLGEQVVFLKDNVTGVTHDLKSSSYNFTSVAGTFGNRFEVVYNSTLSTPTSDFSANSIVAFRNANVLTIEAKNSEMASVRAYDVQGRMVYSKLGINSTLVALSDLKIQNGVLLLQVTSTEGETVTIKVIY